MLQCSVQPMLLQSAVSLFEWARERQTKDTNYEHTEYIQYESRANRLSPKIRALRMRRVPSYIRHLFSEFSIVIKASIFQICLFRSDLNLPPIKSVGIHGNTLQRKQCRYAKVPEIWQQILQLPLYICMRSVPLLSDLSGCGPLCNNRSVCCNIEVTARV